MTGRRWFAITVALILTAGTVVAAAGIFIDPYGLWRDPTAKSRSTYYFDRKAKFFLNKRYVPANFDGLMIGSSTSQNWNFATLNGSRIYNESLSAASATEERIVVNQALARGHFKLALVSLSPSLTAKHSVLDGMDSTNNTESLFSIHLLSHEVAQMLRWANKSFPRDDTPPNGLIELKTSRVFHPEFHDPAYATIDPVAVADYRELIQELQKQGATIVYVLPPLYEPCYQTNFEAFQQYLDRVTPQLPPAPVINFEAPQFNSFRSDPANFLDCHHASAQGGRNVAVLLETLLSAPNWPANSMVDNAALKPSR